ncbi:MAG: SpoIIE family protein phosphatase [Desulfotalea sp.]
MMYFLRVFFLILISTVFLSSQLLAQSIDVKEKKVLLINSYGKGYSWTDNIVKGVENSFAVADNIILKIEYMDTKMINTPSYYGLISQVYAAKYATTKFDAIIVSDDDAFLFIKKYRKTLFPGVPVVFCGVNNFNHVKLKGFIHATGINEKADFGDNLDLIAQLHPEIEKMYVVNDTLTTASHLEEEFKAATVPYQYLIDFVYLDRSISFENLQKKLSELPENSVVFYLSFFKDGEDNNYLPQEVLPILSRVTDSPIYGATDYMLGEGIVGGMLKSSYFQGQTAGKQVLQILSGTNVDRIPVILKSPNHYMFDYNQLEKFDIDLSQLPADSVIVNEPESFYYKYQEVIWVTAGVFSVLMGFIVVLLFNIRKRQRAQRGLHNIINMASSIMDYGSLDKFKEGLVEQLSILLPLKKDPLVMKYTGSADQEGNSKIPSFLTETAKEKISGLPANATNLINNAIEIEKCIVNKKKGVAVFKSAALPGNLVYIESQNGFDDLDRDLLEIFTNNVTMSIQNMEKLKIEKSLETAKQIQMSMLPKKFDEFSANYGVDLDAYLLPAKEVGGDLYDFFAIDDEHLCFLVGDVSDKGVPAALFMTMTKSLIRASSEDSIDPSYILQKANTQLSRDNEQSMFVTLFIGVYNIKTRELSYTSAGHNPPYIVTPVGEVKCIKPIPAMVLGAFEETVYTTNYMTINEGEGLYIFSDGVTEALNKAQELFGEDRLEESLAKYYQGSAKNMNEAIVKDLATFVDGAAQSDDISMLYVVL